MDSFHEAVPIRSAGSDCCFALEGQVHSEREFVISGERVTFHGRIRNVGRDVGTVYVILRARSSYLARNVVLDSHLGPDRFDLRIADIGRGEVRPFSLHRRCPDTVLPSHYQLEAELWSPPRLFDADGVHRFQASPPMAGFMVP